MYNLCVQIIRGEIMKAFNFKVLKGLINHYQNCVCYILFNETIKDKNKAIETLNDDFDALMDEIVECETLDELRLLTDRPLTYYCSQYDLELLVGAIEE